MPSDRRRAAGGDLVVAHAARAVRRRSLRSKATALAFGVALVAGACDGAVAQQGDAPRITVAPTIVAEPASQAALVIQVSPSSALPSNSFVRLRGLPVSVSLSEGHAIAPGSWAVPLFGLPSLKAIVPAGVSGRTEIIIHLVAVDGTMLAETRTALVVGPNMIAPPDKTQGASLPKRPSLAPAPLPAGRPDRSVQPLPTDLGAEDRARAEKLVTQGERHLEQGNISAARMFFQRASETGLAAGAVKMAATYDPVELERLGINVQGVAADRAEARKWYERARELGAPEAEERLARIGGR